LLPLVAAERCCCAGVVLESLIGGRVTGRSPRRRVDARGHPANRGALVPARFEPAVCSAGVAWIVALAPSLWRFTPWLLATRLDGKDR
jgi:hypothetical protein